MFNLKRIKELESSLQEYKDSYNRTLEKLSWKESELLQLKDRLKEAKDLSFILNKINDKNCITVAGTGLISSSSMGIPTISLSDDIPQYVVDIFDDSKKVIKQESNLGILIDKDGNVTKGRTRFGNDKDRNYKLKQL
jgi:hypothetical protein